jgi:hypothetical protein
MGEPMTPFTVRDSSTGRASFCEVLFPSKPAQAVLDELKAAGFKPFKDWKTKTWWWWGKREKLPKRYIADAAAALLPAVNKALADFPATPRASEPPKVSEQPLPKESSPQAQETPPAPAPVEQEEEVFLIEEKPEVKPEPVKPPALKVRRTFGNITSGWSVVHVASNKALGKQFTNISSEELATRLMNAVLPLADWTLPLEKLVKAPGLREKLAEAALEKGTANDDEDDTNKTGPIVSKAQHDALRSKLGIADHIGGVTEMVVKPEVKPPAAENKPESGKTYALTGKSGDKCVGNGNTWAESEVKPAEPAPEVKKDEPPACAAAKVDHVGRLRELMTRRT